MTKNAIITLIVVVTGIAAIIYAISIATKNFSILAVSPLVLGFLVCPLMCGVIAGGMWLSRRLSKNEHKTNLQTNSDACCQHDHEHDPDTLYKNKANRGDRRVSGAEPANTELKTNKDNNTPNLNPSKPTFYSKFKDSS